MSTSMPIRKIDDKILNSLSPDTRTLLIAFCDGLVHAEKLAAGYLIEKEVTFSPDIDHPMERFQEDCRLAFSITWTKAVVISRGIIDELNAGNLLIAFQAMRAYVELVATVRHVHVCLLPIVKSITTDGVTSSNDMRKLNDLLYVFLHGGRFDWPTYFAEGADAILDKKKMQRKKAQKEEEDQKSIGIGKCIREWSKEEPTVEFIYDYLCDLVHPNKGSNLVLITDYKGRAAFSADETSKMGMFIFDRIFPHVSHLCMGAMSKYMPMFALLGAQDEAMLNS